LDDYNLHLPDTFENEVSIFPLPNVVLFPGVVQALHIFEPRYREMIKDSLETDRLIAIALLKPQAISVPPPVFSTICIGKIVANAQLNDGRYNLLLGGVSRALIEDEVLLNKPYRRARVFIPQETNLDSPRLFSLRKEIGSAFQSLTERRSENVDEILEALLEPNLPIGRLLDLVTFGSGAPSDWQQRVLELIDLEQRAEVVLQLLQALLSAPATDTDAGDFPPNFSLN